jgi:protein-disulfide isomerase
MVLLFALLGVIGVAVAVLLVVVFAGSGSGSSSASGATLPEADAVAQQFDGIPQTGNVLGKPNAPATMIEYIDLQCPVCRAFESDTMPTIVQRYVRPGKLKVIARPIAIIGPDSERGVRGMIAAGKQNRAFNFAQILYFNQGPENGGWLDDSMVASAAKSIPGVDVRALQDAVNSSAVKGQAQTFANQAQAINLSGTPTVLVGKTGGKLTEVTPGQAPDVAATSAAINNALAQ